MIKRLIIVILLYCVAIAPALAVGGISLDPSQNLYAARQLGMGGVAVAFSDDASGVFSNPSLLTNLEFPQMTGASRKLVLDETQYLLLSWAMPTKWGTFGIGYTGMNTGGSLPTKLDPASGRIMIDPSREATSYDNSVIALSYSRNVRENLSVGGNLKLFNQSLSGDTYSRATGTGIDLAAVYQFNPWLTIGANLQNLIEGNVAWEGGASDKVGGFYKVGCKVNIMGPTGEALRTHSQKLYGGIDIGIPHSTHSPSEYGLGLEYFPYDKLALRTGLNNNGFTLGIGVVNGGFRFDYAYAGRSDIPGDTPHYFSLSYIGERVITHKYKLMRKESAIVFHEPKDRLVTDQDNINIEATAHAAKVLDKKIIYTVTAVSATYEVKELIELEDFTNLYMNGVELKDKVTVETSSPLSFGRNVFTLVGYTTPEAMPGKKFLEVFAGSGEARVLRVVPFKDVPVTHWATDPIYLCVTLGLAKGYPDNSFKPDKGITRAELVTLIVRTMPINIDAIMSLSEFKDVPITHWAEKFIAYGADKKLVTGYPDGTFKPNKVLTRAEGATILARYSGLAEKVPATPPFPDLQPDYWANKYIAAAKDAGLLKYLVGKDFEPTTPFTRAEACEVLYRTPKIQARVNQFWNTGIVSAQQVEVATPIKTTTPATTEAAPTAPPPETTPATSEAQ